MNNSGLFVTLGAFGVAVSAAAQTPLGFHGVGDLAGGAFASRALGIDPAGLVVVGESMTANGWRAFRWTLTGGIQSLGELSPGDQFSMATSVNGSMGAIVGASGFAPSVFECSAVRWIGGQPPATALGPLAGGGSTSLALAVSANGPPVIVGQAGASPGGPRAFRWTQATGAVALGSLPGGGPDNSAATGVSQDGSVVVGFAQDAGFKIMAFRWTQATGMVALGVLAGAQFLSSRAHACSMDGLVVVGESASGQGPQQAFRWTQAGGMVGLGDLPGGVFRSVASALSGDGAVVVGSSDSAPGTRAFIWDQLHGMRGLKETLLALGWPVQGWTLTQATGVG